MAIRLAVAGAAGRMGRRIIALAHEAADLQCVAALERAECRELGTDAGELAGVGRISVPVTSRADAEFDVLVEFSLPEGTRQWLEVCLAEGKPMVTGATGHEQTDEIKIREAAERIPIIRAPNMSVGINVMLRVARLLATTLDEAYDVEIAETHHRFKVDAPSGTALAIRDAVESGRKEVGLQSSSVVYGRQGRTGPRPSGEIGIHTLRLGDTVGEHTLSFGALGETLSVSHSAHSRDTFAAGALRASKWIVGKGPGLYSMQDVLFGHE